MSTLGRAQSLVVATLATVSACSDGLDYTVVTPGDDVLERIDGHRSQASLAPGPISLSSVMFEVPSSADWRFRLASPTSIYAMEAPACRVLVVDPLDQAAHVFNYRGEYLQSIDLASSAVRGIDGMRRNRETGWVELLSTDGLPAVRFVLTDSVALQAPDQGALDLWEVGTARSANIAEILADRTASVLGDLNLWVDGDPALTAELNGGIVVVRSEGTYFARYSDGRIFKLSTARGREELEQTIELATFFRADAPARYVRDGPGEIPVQMERHLEAFDVAKDGTLVVVQTVSPGTEWRLQLLSRYGEAVTSAPVGRVGALTTADNIIATIQSAPSAEAWSRRRVIVAYTNPAAGAPSCWESGGRVAAAIQISGGIQ